MSWNCGSCVAAILLAQAQSKAQTISCTTSRCTITITRTTPAKKKGWTRRALRRCSPRQHRGRHHRRYPPAWRRTSEAGTPGARAQSHGRLGKLKTDCPSCSVLFTCGCDARNNTNKSHRRGQLAPDVNSGCKHSVRQHDATRCARENGRRGVLRPLPNFHLRIGREARGTTQLGCAESAHRRAAFPC